jgi:hypothetical protein
MPSRISQLTVQRLARPETRVNDVVEDIDNQID